MQYFNTKRSIKTRSLDDFLNVSHTPNKRSQIIPTSTNTVILPSKCTKCGTRTKQAETGQFKKTGELIPQVICTNKQCNAKYGKIKNDVQMVGTAFDKLIIGCSLREIKDILKRKYSCTRSHVEISKWLKKYQKLTKILTDDIACSLQYGDVWEVDETYVKLSNGQCWITAVLDEDSRFIIAYIVTKKRPNGSMLETVFSEARTVAGIPKIITTDLYREYPKAIQKIFVDKNVEHRKIKGKSFVGSNHNNYIERSWKTIKRNTLQNSSEWKDGEDRIYYAILHYNYIQIHSNFDTTPAVTAGYVKPFENFEDILNCSYSYEKAFLFNLKDYIKFVNIKTPNHCSEIIISPKASADCETTKSISQILEDCDFTFSKNKRGWVRKTPLLHILAQNRTFGIKELPERSFEICNKCAKMTISLQEIYEQNGFRRMKDGVVRTQPRCRVCRGSKIDKARQSTLDSIMPIDMITSKNQSTLITFPTHPISNRLRHIDTCITEDVYNNEKYLQLKIHGELPRQVFLRNNY